LHDGFEGQPSCRGREVHRTGQRDGREQTSEQRGQQAHGGDEHQ
jgi:hypothetical protein